MRFKQAKIIVQCLSLLAATQVGTVAYGQQKNDNVNSVKVRNRTIDKNVAVGGRINVVDVDTIGNPLLGFGLFVDLPISKGVAGEGTVDYWNKTSGAIAERSVSVSDLAIGGLVKFVLESRRGFQPFLGAGLSAHRIVSSYSEIKENDEKDNTRLDPYNEKDQEVVVKGAFDLVAGALYEIQTAFDLVAEIKYRSLADDQVDLDQISLSIGLAYKI